jgi:hypothetical protein
MTFFQLQWLYRVQYDSFTHVVRQTDERDSVSCKKDVALPQLTALPRRLVKEQTLDTYQAGPLIAGVHSASYTKPQAPTALQQANLACGFWNTKQTLDAEQMLIHFLRNSCSDVLLSKHESDCDLDGVEYGPSYPGHPCRQNTGPCQRYTSYNLSLSTDRHLLDVQFIRSLKSNLSTDVTTEHIISRINSDTQATTALQPNVSVTGIDQLRTTNT